MTTRFFLGKCFTYPCDTDIQISKRYTCTAEQKRINEGNQFSLIHPFTRD